MGRQSVLFILQPGLIEMWISEWIIKVMKKKNWMINPVSHHTCTNCRDCNERKGQDNGNTG